MGWPLCRYAAKPSRTSDFWPAFAKRVPGDGYTYVFRHGKMNHDHRSLMDYWKQVVCLVWIRQLHHCSEAALVVPGMGLRMCCMCRCFSLPGWEMPGLMVPDSISRSSKLWTRPLMNGGEQNRARVRFCPLYGNLWPSPEEGCAKYVQLCSVIV